MWEIVGAIAICYVVYLLLNFVAGAIFGRWL
jgi:hypothetical protein